MPENFGAQQNVQMAKEEAEPGAEGEEEEHERKSGAPRCCK